MDVINLILDHLKRLPGEWIGEAIRHHEKKKRAEDAIDTMFAFLEAIHERRNDEALSLCTPELQALFKPEAIVLEFEAIRKHLTDVTAFDPEAPLQFSGNSCHLCGTLNYSANRSSHFSLDAVLQGGHWRVNGYEFDAVPVNTEWLTNLLKPKPQIDDRGVEPIEGDNCPADYPIKVSSSKIYHLPSGQYYAATRAVRCFATEAEAKAAGFRPARR